jgi:nitrogen regulatory protein PII
MHLLVCVINQEEKLEAVLSGFLDVGVTGATVIKSEGMGHKLSKELPALAGLQSLLSQTRPQNTTVFSVIESDAKLEAAVKRLQDVCGDFSAPATGIVFTLPVTRVVGLAPELEQGDK